MNEHGDGGDGLRIPTLLPDGQQVIVDNKYQEALADRVVLSNQDNPVDFEELGIHVFGGHFNPNTLGRALTAMVGDLNNRFSDKRWQVVISGDEPQKQKLYLARIPEVEEFPAEVVSSALVVVESEETALERRYSEFSNNFMEKLGEIDLANLREAMFREPERIKAEIDEVSKSVVKLKAGKLAVPQSSELLEKPDTQKVPAAKDRIKGLLALSLADPEHRSIRNKWAWGRELNDLILFAGGGEDGRGVVFDAISELSDVEKALVLSQLSMTKRYEVLLVGVDQVNEREMASFLSNAVYKYRSTEDTEEIEMVIESIVKRDSLDGFEAGKVIDALKTHFPKRFDLILSKLIDAARQADFVHDLKAILRSNDLTSPMVNDLEEGVGEENIKVDRFRRL